MKTNNTLLNISVVIPCHNSENAIASTLRSILNQSYECFEIIIVDNNSVEADNTAEVIKGFDDSRIRYLKPAVCANGNQARNIGSQEARGDFIAYCDSDDEWESDHIEGRVDLHEQTAAPAIYGGAKIQNGSQVKVDVSRPLLEGESPVEFLIGSKKSLAQTSSFFIDKKVWESCRWDENLKRHQDYEFFIAVYRLFGWQYFNRPTYIIHWNGRDIRHHHFDSYWMFYNKYKSELSPASKARYLFTRWKEACLFDSTEEFVGLFGAELQLVKSNLTCVKRCFLSQPWLLRMLWPILRNYS